MAWLRHRIFRLPLTRPRLEREINDELRFHLESRAAELIAGGRSPEDARREAEREFGDLVAARTELRDVDRRRLRKERRADLIDVLRQDLRYAGRGLRRQPAFAAIVVITLALAVGANSAVFSIVDPLLFRAPAGVVHPASLRRVYLRRPSARGGQSRENVGDRFSYLEYTAIRDATVGRARVAAYIVRDSLPLVRGQDTVTAHVGYATADFLPLLGIRADVGRVFTAAEDRVEDPVNSAVLTRSFARRVFGTDANPLGRTFELGHRTFTVIGVLQSEFSGIDVNTVDLWAPFSTSRRPGAPDAHSWYRSGDSYIALVARLQAGETDAAFGASASLADRSAWESSEPELKKAVVMTGSIISARGPERAGQAVSISTRLAIVALIVFLVACANVANLLLLRAANRRREIAVRLALGVSRRRLASQVLAETLLLAFFAGVGALCTSYWTSGLLRTALLPRAHWAASTVSVRVFAFTAAAATLAGCLVALAPLSLALRRDFGASLAVGTRNDILGRSRTRGALLSVQVALSMALVAGASLFVRSLRNVEDIPLGVDAGHVVSASVQFDDHKPHPELETLVPEIAARVASMPNVSAAAYGSGAPFQTSMEGMLLVPRGGGSADSILTNYNAVSSKYLEAAGTRLVQGREFTSTDVAGAEPVMIVSRRTADRLWPGESPLGKCARVETQESPCAVIVGVAEDVTGLQVVGDWLPQFYLPFAQANLPAWELTIRARGSSARDVAVVVRGELRRALPGAIVVSKPVMDYVQPQLRPWRLGAQLFGGLGFLSLLVAAIGLYGVVAFAVQQRTKEIGIRLALGARNADLVRTIVRHAITPVLSGMAAGVLITLAASRFVASLLYGVSPRDPVSITAAAGVLVLAALLACLSPARRATRIDPVIALREE